MIQTVGSVEFQFPYCVGKFNMSDLINYADYDIQFPYCVGKFNSIHM